MTSDVTLAFIICLSSVLVEITVHDVQMFLFGQARDEGVGDGTDLMMGIGVCAAVAFTVCERTYLVIGYLLASVVEAVETLTAGWTGVTDLRHL